jgi:hypothetical protein
MIQILSLKACCRFANRIESQTGNQILNPIDCLNHFAIRCHSVHCSPKVSIPTSRWIHLGHWSPKVLMIRSFPMSHYLTNHCPRIRYWMTHYRSNRCSPMAWNRMGRLSLSCLSSRNCRKIRSAIH